MTYQKEMSVSYNFNFAVVDQEKKVVVDFICQMEEVNSLKF